MSITITVGQPVTLSAAFENPPGTPADPTTVTLDVTDPSGADTTYTGGALTHSATGAYSKIVVPTTAGRWTYRFTASGSLVSVASGVFSVAPEDWTPTLADVGRKLHSRTTDTSMRNTGAFTTDTRPTAIEVAQIIEEETGALIAFVGQDIPSSLWELAHSAALNRIAARIELDYFPDQIATGRSPHDQLVADRDSEEGRLISAVKAHRASLDTGAGAGVASVLTRPQAAIDSETLPLPSDDVPPYAPTGWPLADPQTGSAGTVV